MDAETPYLLSPKQAAALLGLARASIYKIAARDPDFPRPIHVTPRAVRFRRDELDAWIEAQKGAAPPKAAA